MGVSIVLIPQSMGQTPPVASFAFAFVLASTSINSWSSWMRLFVDINLGKKSWRNLGKCWEHDNFGNSMAKHLEGCGNMWDNVGNIGQNSGTIMGKMGTWQRFLR